MNRLCNNSNSVTLLKPTELTRIILYGDGKFNYDINKRIFAATIKFIKGIDLINH